MNISSTKILNHKKNGFIIIIYLIKKFDKIIKYIIIIVRNKSIKIAKLLALVLVTFLISSSRSANAYQTSPSFFSVAVEATTSICETSQDIVDDKSQSVIQTSQINYNSELYSNKKITLQQPFQKTKTKNLVHNLSKKRLLSEILLVENSELETTKLKNLGVLYLVNLQISQKILSSFFLSLNTQTILRLQLINLVINQNKFFWGNFYKDFLDSPEKEKEKSVSITAPIIVLNYKTGDKVLLTCNVKKHNLHTGDEGIITSVIENTNKIRVAFKVGQRLKPLDFRKQLENIVSIFVKQV